MMINTLKKNGYTENINTDGEPTRVLTKKYTMRKGTNTYSFVVVVDLREVQTIKFMVFDNGSERYIPSENVVALVDELQLFLGQLPNEVKVLYE
jgi:hypothetical protein